MELQAPSDGLLASVNLRVYLLFFFLLACEKTLLGPGAKKDGCFHRLFFCQPDHIGKIFSPRMTQQALFGRVAIKVPPKRVLPNQGPRSCTARCGA